MTGARIALLYGLTVLTMGGSWYGIHLQAASTVDPAVSVVWRFVVGGGILLVLAAATGSRLRFRAAEHGWIALHGLLMFSANQVLVYLGAQGLSSGLVAVIFSTLAVMNAINGTLLFGEPLRPGVLLGGVLGVAGMALIFLPHLSAGAGAGIMPYALVCLASAFLTSLGVLVSQRCQRRGVPVLGGTAAAMLYGALICAAYAALSGAAFTIEASPAYLGSLAYVGVIGTAFAFWAFLALVGEIGADRTGYVTVLFPIVALAMSTLFEGYTWSPSAGAGLALVLIGNLLALRGVRRGRSAAPAHG